MEYSPEHIISEKEIALIAGFNIHGLALARALARANVEVHAISPYANMAANLTRYAQVHFRPGVNTDSLVSILTDFAHDHLQNRKAVLYPTSDRMVRAIGENWRALKASYLLSWSDSIDVILEMLDKDNLAEMCRRSGVAYPESHVLTSRADCDRLPAQIPFPCMVKPVRPQSSFKALKQSSVAELRSLCDQFKDDLPFVAQQFIEGDNSDLFFCSMYLDAGRELSVFTGRKLLASPPGTGQGTIMTSEPNSDVLELTRRFLNGLKFNGPVSVEFKRDSNGKFWLIEPNVGRTEYCVDLLIHAGFNFPLIEYVQLTSPKDHEVKSVGRRKTTWFDTEKDSLCFLRYVFSLRSRGRSRGKFVFPYYGHNDLRPLFKALIIDIRRPLEQLFGKLFRK